MFHRPLAQIVSVIGVGLTVLLLGKLDSARGAEDLAAPASALSSTNYHNVFQVTPRIFSGSQPEGNAAFDELVRRGVKTIISVDGARPDIEAARRHGLRYVHLPFGYDGIPTNRWAELVRAAESFPGPVYMHCHHGKHRGPAAVAVLCMAREGWTPGRAESWLHQAGTAPEYPGLYETLRQFKTPDAATMARVRALPEVSPPTTVVAAMVDLDVRLENLKSAQKSGWKPPPESPDRGPDRDAVLLWEQLRELGRHPETSGRPVGYREKLLAAEEAARRFRDTLAASPAPDSKVCDAAFGPLVQSCSACHQAYRN